MKLAKRNCLDGYNWRCNYCGNRKAVRTGSFFEVHRISVILLFKLIVHWVIQSKYHGLKAIFPVSRQAIYDFYHRLRFVALRDYDRDNVQLGGPGVVVEIDESLFMKVNTNCILAFVCCCIKKNI